jgi:hypothetical protein
LESLIWYLLNKLCVWSLYTKSTPYIH